jgi:hypothetical protein
VRASSSSQCSSGAPCSNRTRDGMGGFRQWQPHCGAAENASFDILVVADKNLRYQQNLATRRIAIVELWTNHRPTLETQFERIAAAVNAAVPGSYTKA